MTDQQTYTNSEGQVLTLDRDEILTADLAITLHGRDWSIIPAYALLAMIDRAAPDAMRGYLRERSDLMDSPDESCSTLESMLPADLAAKVARYRIDAVPEADSPEDIDERRLCDPLTDGDLADLRESGRQLGEAWRALSDAFREASKGSDR